AATFLIGETDDAGIISDLTGRVRQANLAMVGAGAFVFAAAYIDRFDLLGDFLAHPISIFGVVAASLPLILFWKVLKKRRPWFLRSIAGFQLAMILLAWLAVMYPDFISY